MIPPRLELAAAFRTLILGSFFVGVALTLAAVFGIPWLWRLVRPWLHAATG